ncbi:MAG: nitroreductase family protein [Anaerolineales bacterium]|nr:nitroreductase family protein [Anaerolineales bacterium]
MSDPADSFYKLIEGRHSVRRFKGTPVVEGVLKRILAAGIHAPSAHNRQPWRFVVLRALEARERLARRMGERLREDLERDGLEPAAIERDVERSYARISGAPVVVVVCMDQETMDEYPDPARRQAEFLMGVQGVAMAGQNILLAAHAEGLGGCWICAPLFVPNLVRDELGLPQSWSPQGLILLGYPADPGKARGRKRLGEVTLWK